MVGSALECYQQPSMLRTESPPNQVGQEAMCLCFSLTKVVGQG